MLPIEVGLQIQEALEDQVITHSETAQMLTTILSSVVGAMVIAFGMVMFYKVLGGNPHSNPGMASDEIIRRAGLKEYEYKWFPPPEEEKEPHLYPYARTRHIGPYEIYMTRTDGTCRIRFYEYTEEKGRKLRATWTGINIPECEKKFEEVVDTVIQVRFESKTALGR